MKSKKVRIVSTVLMMVMLLALLPIACYAEEVSIENKTITIVDDVGRVVEIPYPVKRVVAFNRYTVEFVRAVGGISVIAGMGRASAQINEYWPGFDMNNIAGENQKGPDYEKIVSLNPQVVIFPRNGAWAEAEEKLEPFGIKIFVLTFWDTEKHVTNVATLGLMFDKRERAQELIDFYQGHVNLVQSGVKKLERKKRVYYESHGFGADYTTCLVGSGWHDMIEMAGGINIFGDIYFPAQSKAKGSVHAFEVDPEAILLKNPELVLKMEPGPEVLGGGSTYFPAPQSEMKATWERLVSRPGWDKLDAVKNNQVYVMVLPAAGSCSKMIGVCYLAKWLYPELFPDLDPEAVFKKWLEEFQGVPYPGKYFYHPES